MKVGRSILLLLILVMGSVIVQAQDNNPSVLSNNVFVFMGITLLGLVIVVLILWRNSGISSKADSLTKSEIVLIEGEEYTEQLMPAEHSPIVFDPPKIRLPMERADGDTRPYLVIEVRQSKSPSLPVGERCIIKPDHTPFVIGSRSSCDLYIEETYVSGEHLFIDFDESLSQYILTDRNSSNGSLWDGAPMVKKLAYPITSSRDVTLEIAVNYIFTIYVDECIDPGIGGGLTDEEEWIHVDLPEQELLPTGVIALLNWQSPEINSEQAMQITHTITSIGHGDEAGLDVQINHHLISKLHAYLIWKEKQFFLLDVSLRGTWLTVDSQMRIPVEKGVYVPLEADASLNIELAYDAVSLTFRYKIIEEEPLIESPKQDHDITDKLPELPLRVRPLFHVVRDGENEQRRDVRISTSIITIGRAVTNIVCIPRESIAELHAQIIWEDDKFWFDDLSGMGMTVNGRRIRSKRIALDPKTIYEIRINEGQSDEVEFAFYYDLPIEDTPESTDSTLLPDVEHTQAIDANRS